MRSYSGATWERAMKREEIILRAYAKKISWIEAAEILGMSCRHLRRVREKYDEWGFDGLHDARVGKESPRRMPVAVVEEVLRLYRDEYFDFNVVHFHEKLMERHQMTVSYTWVKALLQGSGLVAKDRVRKKHRRRRERKPLTGMMMHIDGSEHQWFCDERWYDLIALMDDATGEIGHAQLVEEESTRTVMAGIRVRDRNKRDILQFVFGPCEPFLGNAKGRRAGRPPGIDAGRAGTSGARHSNDPGLFSAGQRPQREGVQNMAGASAAGVENTEYNHAR